MPKLFLQIERSLLDAEPQKPGRCLARWFVRSAGLAAFSVIVGSAAAQELDLNPKVLYQIEYASPHQRGGANRPLDDVDGDGLKDHLVVDLNVRTATVYSGADGRILHRLAYEFPPRSSLGSWDSNFGQLGDLDGDNVNDFIAGDIGYSATIFSGRTGQIIRTHRSRDQLFGVGTYGLGDLDGDGITDYAIRTFTHTPLELGEAYSIGIHSGATGAELAILTSWPRSGSGGSGEWGGGALFVGINDINGDGRADIAVVEDNPNSSKIWFVSGAVRGQVDLDNLPPEWVLGRYDSPHRLSNWVDPVNVGDLDGDGFDEVVAQMWQLPRWGFRVVSTKKAEAVWDRIADERRTWVGRISDLNGDGVPELVTAYWEAIRRAGKLEVVKAGFEVLSGADGTELSFFSPTDDSLPLIYPISDLDGDGIEELAVNDTHWNDDTGRLLIYSLGPASQDPAPYRPGNPKLTIHATPDEVAIAWPAAITNPMPEWSTDLQTWSPLFDGPAPGHGWGILPGTQDDSEKYFRLRYEQE